LSVGCYQLQNLAYCPAMRSLFIIRDQHKVLAHRERHDFFIFSRSDSVPVKVTAGRRQRQTWHRWINYFIV
jgi:hypothetical protein